MVLVDDGSVVRYWNPAAEAITGLPAHEVIDKAVGAILSGWNTVTELVPVSEVPGPEGAAAKTLPLELDGKELWLSISGVRFGDGVVYAFRDVTEERALDELKGEFVATISHELRTPLAAIYGSAQTLQRRDLKLDEGTRERLLEVIAAESERLTRIAGDILLANSLDSGRLRLESGHVELAALAKDVVDEMRAAFAEREDIMITLEPVNGGGTEVSADPDKLRQVLINLIDNAVKYSPEGGRVQVEVEPRDSGIRVVVRDEGIGIPGSEQQRIFGKFYRIDPQLSRGVGGTGLGLYICRELVRRMQGRISVESREGTGSTFCIDLPVAPVSASQRQTAVSEPA